MQPRDRVAASSSPPPNDLPLPPGSLGLPIVGESLSFLRDGDFSRRRHDRYGPVFKTRIFGQTTVFLKGEAANQLVFSQDGKALEVQWPSSVARLLGPASLSTQHGSTHRQRRRLMAKAFQPRALEAYGQGMEVLTRQYGDRWAQQGTFAWYPELRRYTLDVACKLLVGLDDGAETRLGHAFETWTNGLFSLPIALPWTAFGKALQAREVLLGELKQLIRDRQCQGEVPNEASARDALDLLLVAEDETGKRLELDELADQILTLLFAGHETLTSALASFCRLTALYPTVRDRLLAEQAQFDPAVPLCLETLRAMTYLDCVLQEVLRLAPPVGGGFRRTTAPLEYGGYVIPMGWSVLYQINRTHKDPTLYAEPEDFNPDRWLDNRSNPNAYLPFGGGVRECLGKEFARLEMRIFAARMLRGYRWDLEPDQDLSLVVVPTPRPRDGLKVRFQPRVSP